MKSLLVFFLLTGSISSFAKNSLTKVQLETLESAGLLQKLKVKLNKQVTSIYVKGSNRVTDVSTTTITRTIDKETLKEVVPSTIDGVIVKADDEISEEIRGYSFKTGKKRVWVSFDADCFSESCSYRFDSNYSGSKFYLRQAPEHKGYNLAAMKAGKLSPARKRTNRGGGWVTEYQKVAIFLEAAINDKTITNILNTTEIATGH